MKGIYIFNDGIGVNANIKRLFDTDGPYTIEGRRLDQLAKVQVLVDSSVSTIKKTGTTIEKANSGSMLGRAVAGAVIAGGAGAVVGGLSGKKESVTSSISSESIAIDITAELIFEDNGSIYVQIKSNDALHWLLGFANQKPMTDDEIELERNKSLDKIFLAQVEAAYNQVVSNFKYPDGDSKEIAKANSEILRLTFNSLDKIIDIAKKLTYEDFCDKYRFYIYQKNMSLMRAKIDYSDSFSISIQKVSLILVVIFLLYKLTSNNQQPIAEDTGSPSSNIEATLPNNTKIIETYKNTVINGNKIPDNSENMDRVATVELENKNDILYFPGENKPYTGRYETFYPNGSKKGIAHIKDGKFDGVMTLWDENGNIGYQKVIKSGKETPFVEDKKSVREKSGFGLFHDEALAAKNELKCPNSVDSDITPPLYSGGGSLYGCILGKMETVKYFINESSGTGRVLNIKFIWNDWFRNIGFGVHSDKQEAQNSLNTLIKLYAPKKSKELRKIFFGNKSINMKTEKFQFSYTFDRGPAIDERMLIVTELPD